MNATTDLQERARRLSAIAERLGLTQLARVVVEDTARRLDDGVLRAVVVGEIKQGKSTLINAICRQSVLPTGVTPTTGATVVIRGGGDTRYWVERSGERTELDDERFVELARGRGEKPSPDGWLERLVPVADDAWPEGLELIDTPGVNDIATFRSVLSRGELPRADILVVVFDATQLLNRAEMSFLRDALIAVGGFGPSGARLIAVINRIDLVERQERITLVEHLRRELKSLLQGSPVEPEIFTTDARRAANEPGADDDTVAEVRRLRDRLGQLASDRARLLPARARAGLRRYALLLEHNAGVAAHALSRKFEALKREIAELERTRAEQSRDLDAVRERAQTARAQILQESNARIHGFREQLEKGLLASLAKIGLRTISSHLAGAIHDAFLSFVRDESERLRAELDEMSRETIHAYTEAVRRRLFHAALRLGFQGPPVFIDPPSAALEAGLVVVGVTGTAVMYLGNFVTGALMAIAGPLTTVILREKSLRDARDQARALLPRALDEAEQRLSREIRRVVDSHIEALDEHLILASSLLDDQLLAVLNRIKDQIEPEDQDEAKATPNEAIKARQGRARTELAEIEAELRVFQTELERVDEHSPQSHDVGPSSHDNVSPTT